MRRVITHCLITLFLSTPLALAQNQPQPAQPAQPAQGTQPAQTPRPAAPNPNATQSAEFPMPKLDPSGEPNKGFIDRHQRYIERAKQGNIDLLFLGDSITQGWGNNEVWQKHFAPLNAANFGIGGDRTQHVLWRIMNGEIDGIKPKVAVLMIGTNNSGDNSVEQIAAGASKIVMTLRQRLPETRVLLLAIFPRSEKPTDERRLKVQKVNDLLAKLDDGKMIRYLDIGNKFLQEDGTIAKSIMPDFLHLTPAGYQIWADAMMPTLSEMMKN